MSRRTEDRVVQAAFAELLYQSDEGWRLQLESAGEYVENDFMSYDDIINVRRLVQKIIEALKLEK